MTQERERLFHLIVRMVDWDNLNDDELFESVRTEIFRSTGGKPPAILDPFAGGGTIPLEAQRLGFQAHASDLNPVAVLINEVLIEILAKFVGRVPTFPGSAGQRSLWPKSSGLAEDVRRYGKWMRDEAEKRVGHLYPKAVLPDGSTTPAIVWIWARTVACPNPACGIEMPLGVPPKALISRNLLRAVADGRRVQRNRPAKTALVPPATSGCGVGSSLAEALPGQRASRERGRPSPERSRVPGRRCRS